MVLFITRKHAPYVLTKPFHPSQKLLEKNEYGVIISLEVQLNFELEKEILGLGDGAIVLQPDRLRNTISDRLNNAIDQYNTTLPDKKEPELKLKYQNNGFCIINQLYSRRAISQLIPLLSKTLNQSEVPKGILNIDLDIGNSIKSLLFPPTVWKTLSQIAGQVSLKTITYIEHIPTSLCEYSQSVVSGAVLLIIYLAEMKQRSFVVQVIPGTQNKLLSENERQSITQNCIPVDCKINQAGAILLNSSALHRFLPSLQNTHSRLVVIELGPNGLMTS